MSRYHSYLASATKLVDSYRKGTPLAYHLKQFFSGDKKYGSRDRKAIGSMCYHYFRVARALGNASPTAGKIVYALFLCEHKPNDCLQVLGPELNEQVSLPVKSKFELLNIPLSGLFPFTDELGEGIDKELFSVSFLQQPLVFVRIRPGRRDVVIAGLKAAGMPFESAGEHCLRVPGSSALDKVVRMNKDIVVQDLNSQKVFDYLPGHADGAGLQSPVTIWDCCAASGGKSILLYDILKGKVKLTVSDIRENILSNLQKRLQQAGVAIYKRFTADLSKQSGLLAEEKFSIIICDVPCTGSGTWSRNPEQLYSFDRAQILSFHNRQQQIVSNAITHMEEKGLLFYITCSVFKMENEAVVGFIKEKFHLQLLQMEYLKGYEHAADTMFVAVFKK